MASALRIRFRRTPHSEKKNTSTTPTTKESASNTPKPAFSNSSGHSVSHNRTSSRYSHLSPFDECVEACDALAASSEPKNFDLTTSEISPFADCLTQDGESLENAPCESEIASTKRRGDGFGRRNITEGDATKLVPDCSVLVSPDGALLFVPRKVNQRQSDDLLPSGATTPSQQNLPPEKHANTTNRYLWTKIASHADHENEATAVMVGEEYESAIVIGNDLTPKGDYDSNGFSAGGWDQKAATEVMRTSLEFLKSMETYVEDIALCRKDEAAHTSGACSKFRNSILSLSGVEAAARRNDRRTNDEEQKLSRCFQSPRATFNISPSESKRTGPMLLPGTSLHAAIQALEQYYALSAETTSNLWRGVCCTAKRSLSNGTGNYTSANQGEIQGLLPSVRSAVAKATSRISNREKALEEIYLKVKDAEKVLKDQKDWAARQWQRVDLENAEISRRVQVQKEGRIRQVETMKQQNEAKKLEQKTPESLFSQQEIRQMVESAATMEDFEPTGLPMSISVAPDSMPFPKNSGSDNLWASEIGLSASHMNRTEIENESDIEAMKLVAMAADEYVEDAAGALLNILSEKDTTTRSARIATESCLLSQCNTISRSLRSLVEIERSSLETRLQRLRELEAAVNAVNVRNDIDTYIRFDKMLPGGAAHMGRDDDGGIAAGLAVLNSHLDSTINVARPKIKRPHCYEGWPSSESDEAGSIQPEEIENIISMLFDKKMMVEKNISDSESRNDDQGRTAEPPERSDHEQKIKKAVALLSRSLIEKSTKGQALRQSVLYELNSQRSLDTQLKCKSQFDGLCRIFYAFLSGCGREYSDVSDAKMCMILSQTFFFMELDNMDTGASKDIISCRGSIEDRKSRIYVKSKISHHPIWSDDDFWDQALFQCVSESLNKSGVLTSDVVMKNRRDYCKNGEIGLKWHDLPPSEYADVVAQVHSVVFAQLGTLSHSMVELGCGIPRACRFVRRLSIRYQLPLSSRTTLLQHLIKF